MKSTFFYFIMSNGILRRVLPLLLSILPTYIIVIISYFQQKCSKQPKPNTPLKTEVNVVNSYKWKWEGNIFYVSKMVSLREKFFSKWILQDSSCALSASNSETLPRIFKDCLFVRVLWFSIIVSGIDLLHWYSRMDITLYSIHCSSSYDAILVIKWCRLDEILLIWRHHNDHIFNHNSTSFDDIINRIIALVTSYSTGRRAIFTDSHFPWVFGHCACLTWEWFLLYW